MDYETNKQLEDKKQPDDGKLMKFLKGINLLATIVLAVLAFFFDHRQKAIERTQNEIKTKLEEQGKELENRTRQEAITQTYTDKIFAHLADLKLESADNAGMVIDLLDMITEANIKAEPFKNAERQQLMPLRMALLTGNDDILTNIGFAPAKQKLWVDFARQSRNDKVRATALRTLGKIGAYGRGEAQLEELRFCISSIIDISEGFRRLATYDDACSAIDGLTDVIVKEPILLDDNELSALFKKVKIQIARAQSDMLRQPFPQPTTSPPAHAAEPPRTSYRPESEGSLYLPVANSESHPATILLAADVSRQLRQTDATLEKLGKLNLYEQTTRPLVTPSRDTDAKTRELLKKLYSDSAQERLDARTALASQGTVALRPLLNMLQMGNLDPRLKVSLSYALYQMPPSAVISDARDIKLLTGLLGDDQAEVRQYISEFLMKLSDGDTVRAFHDALLAIPHDDVTKTGNAVYNAIVILGTWMRVLPPELDDVKQKIREDLGRLGQEFSGEQWKKTRQLIDEMNSLNKARQ
jgi:hypothetical protein